MYYQLNHKPKTLVKIGSHLLKRKTSDCMLLLTFPFSILTGLCPTCRILYFLSHGVYIIHS